MIVFLIPVRHHDSVEDYEQTWGLLNNTLMSLASQDCPHWHAIVWASQILPIAGVLPQRQITFVPYQGNRICSNPTSWNQADIDTHILDKAERRHHCLDNCYEQNLRPSWYFMADADDYLASDVVSTILNTTEPRHSIVTLDTGIILNAHHGTYTTVHNFHDMCGTSIAISASFINSAHEHDAVDDFLGRPTFYQMLAGQHGSYSNRHSLSGLPRAAYVLHDQNYGQNLYDYSELLALANPITPDIRERFTLPPG